MRRTKYLAVAVCLGSAVWAGRSARANHTWLWSEDGLAVQISFVLVDSTHLELTIQNQSTHQPAAWSGGSPNANQILTRVSFDLPNGVEITGGSARLGADSASLNFDAVAGQLAGGDDVSAEWGYGNDGTSIGLARNFVSALTGHTTAFAAGNLDGPSNLDGPQGGIVSDPPLADLGGLGAVSDTVIFNLTLSDALTLDDLHCPDGGDVCDDLWVAKGYVEFGSDAYVIGPPHFLHAPEPTTLAFLGLGGLAFVAGARIRRRK